MSSRHSFPSLEMTSVIKFFCILPDRFYTSVSKHTHAPTWMGPSCQRQSEYSPPRSQRLPTRCPGLGHRHRQDGSGTSHDEQMFVPSCPLSAISQQCVLDKCTRCCTGSLVGASPPWNRTAAVTPLTTSVLGVQNALELWLQPEGQWRGQTGRDSACAHKDSQAAPS